MDDQGMVSDRGHAAEDAMPSRETEQTASADGDETRAAVGEVKGTQPSLAVAQNNPVNSTTWTQHARALEDIRQMLKLRSSYDLLPVSFRLIVLDTTMQVKKALAALLQNNVVSAPLWDSAKHKFAGMLTVSDIINLIQYYYQMDKTYGDAEKDVERFQLSGLREVEAAIDVPSPSLYFAHPQDRLFEVCKLLSETHARRLPLLDRDEDSGMETIVSVVTQYRVLKFIAMNCRQATMLRRNIRSLGIGTYTPHIATATMQTTVFDVVHLFAKGGISAVPIVDEEGVVVNLYETVDVMTLVRTGAYHSLDLTISEAILRRSPDFAGVRTCTADDSLANILELIRRERVHRFVIVQGEREPQDVNGRSMASSVKGKLVGMLTLSDVLKYLINE